jgi:hypothetical protein
MEVNRMPITISVDHASREVVAVATGPITFEDIREHLIQERDQGGLPYRELIDASKAEPVCSTSDARATVDLLKTLGSQGKLGPTAVIVPNEVSYGLMRMVEILLDEFAKVRPFHAREVAEAREWLEGESR